ncbi:helix-turn-helix transcriptional regulator [Xanthobacter pseudotagetidis]|uniref:helix-turn-helix transcriptional regulator n=1 Tax=Xanthobacter pseudotagetidis TaxID=3119911 RepID=UPI00372A0BF4
MRDAFSPAWFDGAGLPSTERPAEFARAFRAALADVDIEVSAPGAFNVRMLWVALPGARLATCFAAGARFARRAPSREAAGFILLRPVGGRLPVEQCGRRIVLEDRQGALLSLALPFSYTAGDGTRVDHLLMPADIWEAEGAPGPLPLAAADEASLLLLVHYAGAVMQGLIPLKSERHAALASAHMRDLARVVFFPDDEAPAPDRLAALKGTIAPHLKRRDLGLDMVARLMGVTPRAIQKQFQAEGTTFSAYVLEQRLLAAREALAAAGPDRARPVSAVAFESGFGDLSYFNRTFRARFGMTPSAFRRGG